MCGIVASVGPAPLADLAFVEDLAHRLRHRGPDDAGVVAARDHVLAHTRLSIIDVAGGHQPLLGADGRTVLVCNGEIYNHRRLRDSLSRPYSFRTRSDSEVILALYAENGPDCVRRLEGMFAFVLTDGERVLAARDPLGIKPLYVGRDGEGRLWFASEVKALMGVCEEFEAFPPGYSYSTEHGFQCWYQPQWRDPRPEWRPVTPDQIRAALEKAVQKRMMSDVPFGCFLSGGLDSSTIAALMRPHVDELHTFAVGLHGSPDVEAARVVARHLGTRHHEYIYTQNEAVEALETVVYHLESDDPALVRSAIPCYFVSKLAAEHVKVVLSGEGADEAFAGYQYFARIAEPMSLHRECVRLLNGLHNINLQRVDRMTMAHGLEGRVPFLDVEFLEMAMAIHPREKLHHNGRKEKHLLRQAVDQLLPESIVWRTKREFAQGAGSEWTLRDYCAHHVSTAELVRARQQFKEDAPLDKESYFYRRIFETLFPGHAARATVGRWQGALKPAV